VHRRIRNPVLTFAGSLAGDEGCGERLIGSPGGHHFHGPPEPGRGIDSTLPLAYFMRLSSQSTGREQNAPESDRVSDHIGGTARLVTVRAGAQHEGTSNAGDAGN